MSDPLLITADYHAVPKRHWERRIQVEPDLGVYRYDVCGLCRYRVREHIWFLLDADRTTVLDCSEAMPR